MARVKLKKFLPLNNYDKINKLLDYLHYKPNKFTLETCLLSIQDYAVARYFLRESLKRKIWPKKESLIVRLINEITNEERFTICKEKFIPKSTENPKNPLTESSYSRSSLDWKGPLFTPKTKKETTEREQRVFMDNLQKINFDHPNTYRPLAPSTQKSWDGLFAHVLACDLKIKKGVISFKGYWLVSSEIPSVSPEILKSIKHEFCLKRSSDPKSRRFYFVPENDLNYLLDEIDRIRVSKETERADLITSLKIGDKTEDQISKPSLSDISIKPSWDGLYARVLAKDLTIRKGYIFFEGYWLTPIEVPEFTSEVLNLIEHEFCLKRNLDLKNPDNKKFVFEPHDDLVYLLAEIDRLSFPSKNVSMDMYPSSGTFSLPWRYVVFYDGIMYFEHPNPSKRGTSNPYYIKHQTIRKSYRYILPYIQERMSMFRVEAKDGVIIKVLNFTSFEEILPQVFKHSCKFPKGMVILQEKESKIGSSFTKEEFVRRIKKKSPYLNLLSKRQLSDKRIYYLLERVSHTINTNDEFGYLFTIRERNGVVTLIFENEEDESRSSIVFKTKSKDYNAALSEIQNFLGSYTENKRQLLAEKRISLNKNSTLLSISRIIHTNFDSWLSNFNKLFLID